MILPLYLLCISLALFVTSSVIRKIYEVVYSKGEKSERDFLLFLSVWFVSLSCFLLVYATTYLIFTFP